MNLYLDASALVKRYVAEPGSEGLRELMGRADGWFMCRVGYVDTARAVGLAGSPSAVRAVQREWPALNVIEVDQDLVEHATDLAFTHELRSIDALHLASALVLPPDDLIVAVWDRRLHCAARAEGLGLFPETLQERAYVTASDGISVTT